MMQASTKVGGEPTRMADQDHEAARTAVLKAMRVIPSDEKYAFDQAMQRAPDLVMKETDPLLFWRRDHGDANAAAERLSYHWKVRLELFGEERAFLPLNLSGDGAMNQEDIERLKCGFHAFLPDDSAGRTVIFFDNDRGSGSFLDSRESRSSRMRCLFYNTYVATRREKPLVFVRFSRSPKLDQAKASRAHTVFEALPVRMDEFLSVYIPPKGASRMFNETVVPLFENFLGGKNFPAKVTSVVEESPERLLRVLQERGFSKESLPETVGGTWSYDNFTAWVDEQVAAAAEPTMAKAQNSRVRAGRRIPRRPPQCGQRSDLLNGLFSVTKDCLRPDSSAEDVSSKLLLLHLVQKQGENEPLGGPVRRQVIEPSNPSSELAQHIHSVIHKRDRSSACNERMLRALQVPCASTVPSDAMDSILSMSLSRQGVTAEEERGSHNRSSVDEMIARLVSEAEDEERVSNCCGRHHSALTTMDLDSILSNELQGTTSDRPSASRRPSCSTERIQTIVSTMLDDADMMDKREVFDRTASFSDYSLENDLDFIINDCP